MALLLTAATGAWAQDPDPIDLTPSADGTVWTLATMPEYDVELEVTYYTDEELAEMAKGYYLVGNMNGWTPDSKYKLTVNPGNTAEYMITLYLEAAAELKVVYSADGATAQTWYPDPGDNKYIGDEGRYTIYFRPDYQGGGDWHYGCIYVASDPLFATPTGTKNEWVLDVPDYDVELEVEYETDLALNETTDNGAMLDEWDGYEADVTLTRTLQTGGYNTFAVPFNMAIPEGWTVKELNTASISGEVLTLNFADATTIEAGKPYLVKVDAQTDLSQAAFAGAIVSKETQPYTSATVDFIPTLGATDIETDDVRKILFLGAENTLYRTNSTSSMMKGFRAYFQLKEAAEVKGFELNFGDEATGLVEIQNSKFKNQDDDIIYNVAGQRLERTQKGINIVSGKKVIIK